MKPLLYLFRSISALLMCAVLAGGLYGCRQDINSDPLPAQGGSARFLLLIVHGSGNTAADWPAGLKTAVAAALAHPEEWDIVAYDWSLYAENKTTASKAGLAVGEQIGASLASGGYSYEAIQLIGHSAGAFVIQATCDSYRAGGGAARVQLTFLDPFTGNGFIDWTYGKRRFGSGADFAEVYVNTDDPVPSTNGLLRNAHNFDVTALAPGDVTGSDRHWWPVSYYTGTVGSAAAQYGYELSLMHTGLDAPVGFEDYPAGGLTVVQ